MEIQLGLGGTHIPHQHSPDSKTIAPAPGLSLGGAVCPMMTLSSLCSLPFGSCMGLLPHTEPLGGRAHSPPGVPLNSTKWVLGRCVWNR